jgi:hypothetical protein
MTHAAATSLTTLRRPARRSSKRHFLGPPQVLDLPDFALQGGDQGALFRSRIDAQQQLQIEPAQIRSFT